MQKNVNVKKSVSQIILYVVVVDVFTLPYILFMCYTVLALYLLHDKKTTSNGQMIYKIHFILII